MKANPLISLALLSALSLGVAHGGGWSPIYLQAELDRPLLVRGGGEQEVVIKVEITGRKVEEDLQNRPPLNLAVVLDRSGSMSGAKLEKARQAAMMLVDQMGAEDVLSLVIYDTEVEVLAPARKVGKRQAELKRLISRVETGGSTALYAGVETGGRELEEYLDDNAVNRVILLSDGLANVGPQSNREIASLGHRLADKGMSVSTIGLGEDYNEDLMTALAEASDANYYFVDDVELLADVFERELGELKSVVARSITVEIQFPEGVRPIEFLGRDEAIRENRGRVEFGILAGEQKRSVLVRCAVDPEAAKRSGAITDEGVRLAAVQVSYEDALTTGKDRQRELNHVVRAQLTDDGNEAEQKVDYAVRADAVAVSNAGTIRAGLKMADSGDIAGARANFSSQIDKLRQAQAEAPEPKKEMLEREISILEESRDELDAAGELSKTGRKKLQWNIYGVSNSKGQDKSN